MEAIEAVHKFIYLGECKPIVYHVPLEHNLRNHRHNRILLFHAFSMKSLLHEFKGEGSNCVETERKPNRTILSPKSNHLSQIHFKKFKSIKFKKQYAKN